MGIKMNTKHYINLLNKASFAVKLTTHSPSKLYFPTVQPQNPGQKFSTTRATTTPAQFQVTKDTYSRQLGRPPG